MFELIRKAVPVPAKVLPLEGVAAFTTAVAFLWLLAHGYVRPVAVYLLELYLSF